VTFAPNDISPLERRVVPTVWIAGARRRGKRSRDRVRLDHSRKTIAVVITRVPLSCRGSVTSLVAVIDSDEDDREPSPPPAIADRSDHAEACRCACCVLARHTTTPLLGQLP